MVNKLHVKDTWQLLVIITIILGGSGLNLVSFNQFASKKYVINIDCRLLDLEKENRQLTIILDNMNLKHNLSRPYDFATTQRRIERQQDKVKKIDAVYFKKCLEDE